MRELILMNSVLISRVLSPVPHRYTHVRLKIPLYFKSFGMTGPVFARNNWIGSSQFVKNGGKGKRQSENKYPWVFFLDPCFRSWLLLDFHPASKGHLGKGTCYHLVWWLILGVNQIAPWCTQINHYFWVDVWLVLFLEEFGMWPAGLSKVDRIFRGRHY